MAIRPLLLGLFAVSVLGAGCGKDANFTYSDGQPALPPPVFAANTPAGPFTVDSPAFASGEEIPEIYTCKGSDFSPPVRFQSAPAGTASLALIVEDAAAPEITNWVVFNMAPTVAGIMEGDIPPGAIGMSTNDRLGYEGPCPTDGVHRYTFTLYALNAMLPLEDGASKEDIRAAMQGYILSTAVWEGVAVAQ